MTLLLFWRKPVRFEAVSESLHPQNARVRVPADCGRPQERRQVDRMVAVHGDALLADPRGSCLTPRRLRVREIAVVAEPERHRIGCEQITALDPEIVMCR